MTWPPAWTSSDFGWPAALERAREGHRRWNALTPADRITAEHAVDEEIRTMRGPSRTVADLRDELAACHDRQAALRELEATLEAEIADAHAAEEGWFAA